MVVYKPISENDEVKPKYITEDELKEQIKGLNNKDIKELKEDIKLLKRRFEDLTDDIKYKREKPV